MVQDAAHLAFGQVNPFVRWLGLELVRFDGGHAEVRFAPGPDHRNAFEVTHGGALMALLDVCMASAVRSLDPGCGVVTIEMKTSFMRAAEAESGSVLLAKGALIERTPTLAFTQASVLDRHGRVCAHATGTYKFVRRLPDTARRDRTQARGPQQAPQ